MNRQNMDANKQFSECNGNLSSPLMITFLTFMTPIDLTKNEDFNRKL